MWATRRTLRIFQLFLDPSSCGSPGTIARYCTSIHHQDRLYEDVRLPRAEQLGLARTLATEVAVPRWEFRDEQVPRVSVASPSAGSRPCEGGTAFVFEERLDALLGMLKAGLETAGVSRRWSRT